MELEERPDLAFANRDNFDVNCGVDSVGEGITSRF